MKEVLRNDKENIFIPTSGSDVTLIKIIPQLTMLVRENPDVNIHLFGYPEWQTYTKNHLDSFFELDTYFYSSFYTNNMLPAAINFINSYHKWYSKDMTVNYPQYGMLGLIPVFSLWADCCLPVRAWPVPANSRDRQISGNIRFIILYNVSSGQGANRLVARNTGRCASTDRR